MATSTTVAKAVGAHAASGEKTASHAAQALYWPQLDGVRALAFLLVFLHHADPVPAQTALARAYNCLVPWGIAGVDLFFVLSGFLITTLLLQEKIKTSTVSYKAFFVRRALRIWPLYFLALFLAGFIVPLWHHLPRHMYTKYLLSQIVPGVFFVGNMAMIQTELWMGAFAKMGLPTFTLIAPLWSLSIEEQFYFTWPNLLKLSAKPLTLYSILIGVTLFSLFARGYFYFYSQTHAISHLIYYINTLTRLEPIAAGAAIAVTFCYFPRHFQRLSRYTLPLLFLVAIGLAVLVYCCPPMLTRHSSIIAAFLLIAVNAATVLLLSLTSEPVARLFSNRFLVHIGKLTYCMYLFHAYILDLVRSFFFNVLHWQNTACTWFFCATVTMSLTYVWARLCWTLIERPFLKLKSRYSKI